jgi:hypothetical protein
MNLQQIVESITNFSKFNTEHPEIGAFVGSVADGMDAKALYDFLKPDEPFAKWFYREVRELDCPMSHSTPAVKYKPAGNVYDLANVGDITLTWQLAMDLIFKSKLAKSWQVQEYLVLHNSCNNVLYFIKNDLGDLLAQTDIQELQDCLIAISDLIPDDIPKPFDPFDVCL